jgi:hypothetical protein
VYANFDTHETAPKANISVRIKFLILFIVLNRILIDYKTLRGRLQRCL